MITTRENGYTQPKRTEETYLHINPGNGYEFRPINEKPIT